MSGEPTPERLDALLDGGVPTDDAERDVLHLAARMRDAAPRPDDELRVHLLGLGEPAAPRRGPGRRLAWTLGPVLGAVVAVVVAVGLLGDRSGDGDLATSTTTVERSADPTRAASEATSAAPAAGAADQAFTSTGSSEPEPWRWAVPAGDVDATVDAIRTTVAAGGGTSTREAVGGAIRVRIDAPQDRLAQLRDELARLAAARSGPDAAVGSAAAPVIVIDVTAR